MVVPSSCAATLCIADCQSVLPTPASCSEKRTWLRSVRRTGAPWPPCCSSRHCCPTGLHRPMAARQPAYRPPLPRVARQAHPPAARPRLYCRPARRRARWAVLGALTLHAPLPASWPSGAPLQQCASPAGQLPAAMLLWPAAAARHKALACSRPSRRWQRSGRRPALMHWSTQPWSQHPLPGRPLQMRTPSSCGSSGWMPHPPAPAVRGRAH